MTSALIVRLGALGDVVHAMPVVAALRRRWPDLRIDWLVDPRYAEVVALVRGVGRVISFDPRRLIAGGERAEMLQTIGELRGERYDVVLDLQGLLKSASVARLAAGARTIGFAKAHLREPAARFFYSETVEVPDGVHIITKNLTLLTALDIPVTEPRFDLALSSSSAVDAVTAASGQAGYVAVNPGAGWPNKRWPADRFGALARHLLDRHGARTISIWGPGEETLAQDVVAASAGAASLAPATSAVDLFGIFGGARLTVAGDTGPLHIAAAMGTPVVGLFGPTDPGRNGPWHPDDECVTRWETCECRYERRCRRATPCVDDISVEDVIAAADRRLSGRASGARA